MSSYYPSSCEQLDKGSPPHLGVQPLPQLGDDGSVARLHVSQALLGCGGGGLRGGGGGGGGLRGAITQGTSVHTHTHKHTNARAYLIST